MRDYRTLLEGLRDSYNDRDPDTWIEAWTPDCEWHPFLTAREEGDPGYHGHNGMRAWFEDVAEMFEESRVDLDQVREIGNLLLVLGQMTATRRGSGAEVKSEVAWMVEPRGAKLQRGWSYDSHELGEREARAAASS